MGEIFLCVLRLDFPESRRLHRFDKKRVVRNGGVSLIRRHRQVTIHTALAPGGYMLVPSTWELDVSAQFELTVYCDCAPGVVALEELNRCPKQRCHAAWAVLFFSNRLSCAPKCAIFI